MVDITVKEFNAIEELLGYELILVNKYKRYSELCQDAQLKTFCEQIASQHKNHYELILKNLKG